MDNGFFSFFTRTASVEDNCRRYFEEDWCNGMSSTNEPKVAPRLFADESIPF